MALYSNWKACLAMVLIQFIYSGMALLSKAALNDGMNSLVLVVYRQATATLTLAPFVYCLEWGRPHSLSFIVFCKIFLLSLFGLTLSMDLYFLALRHTSATFASAAFNVVPVVTFFIAVILRVEKVEWSRIYCDCKIIGLVLSAGGAVILCLYQGPPLKFLSWHVQVTPQPGGRFHGEKQKDQIKGPLLLFAAFTCWSTWVVMQAEMLTAYPAKLSLTTLQCFLSTIQSGVIAVAADRNLNSWRFTWNVQLISVIYCGIIVSGLAYWLQTWCVEKKGPVFVAAFSPLATLVTAIVSSLIWAESLYLGSVLGGVLIVGGLYCVQWGKSKEGTSISLDNLSTRSPTKATLDIESG